jgi:hypothetical protein
MAHIAIKGAKKIIGCGPCTRTVTLKRWDITANSAISLLAEILSKNRFSVTGAPVSG